MKKITAIIMASIMLASTTVNAAWEFDEKVITKSANSGAIDNGVIATYNHGYEGANMSEYSYVIGYYDLYGNRIEKPEKGNVKNTEIKENYFSKNNQSIIITEDDGIKLTDLNGTTLASGFELSNSWEKNDVARKVKKNERYGIMAYDGRMIIPMENDGAVIYDHDIYVAVNKNIVSAYNFAGELLFTLDKGIEIIKVGSDDWIVVRNKEQNKYALINYKGKYLTDFEYSFISLYDNDAAWQSGSFSVLYNGSGEKYIDRDLKEIDIFSEKGVYCQDYIDLGNTSVINNSTQNHVPMTALYNKLKGEYIIPFRDGETISNGDVLIYTDADNSYLSDVYGNNTNKMNYKINSLDEFSGGTAKIYNSNYYQNFIDIYGEEIFEKNYYSAYRIDNNEFLVTEGDYRNYRTVKILTAKGIIGEALYTDVKIDINGVQIPCRSVYGYAGVIAEDLRNFGFDVIWDEEKRLLTITRNPDYYNITPIEYEADGTAGTHYADIYGSDINVEYNGKRISSYCIDGRTIIKPEDLATEGIAFNYDDSVRTLFMSIEGLERK